MATKKSESSESSKSDPKVMDFNDPALEDVHTRQQPYPENVRIPGPYGKAQFDAGTLEATGSATGDDGNAGSTGGTPARGGADDS